MELGIRFESEYAYAIGTNMLEKRIGEPTQDITWGACIRDDSGKCHKCIDASLPHNKAWYAN